MRNCEFSAVYTGLALLLSVLLSPSAEAQGTAFGYQGSLTDHGAPANGLYDITLSAFAAPTAGSPLATYSASVQVANGRFSASPDFGAGIFDGSDRWLELAVRPTGTGPFTTLSPRQQVFPTPYAIFAEGVRAAGLSGVLPAGSIADGTITAGALAPGAAAANLQASGQLQTPAGGSILSTNGDDGTLLNAAFVKVGKIELPDVWEQRASGSAPSARENHSAVWTGSEMIVWGGASGTFLNSGVRYNPAANAWTPITTTGAPSARTGQTAIWTGSEMLIWGGKDNSQALLNSGGRYNPAADAWTTLPTTGAPAARLGHTAVWTGKEMIVWGGSSLNTGARFDAGTGTWTAVPTTGAPSGRSGHTAVWTGTQMIVWGGVNSASTPLNDGGVYDPVANNWQALAASGAPSARSLHSAVWTGNAMVIWGGTNSSANLNDGARYNPGTQQWTAVSTTGAPSARSSHTAVWSGNEMLVWGGLGSGALNDGARYNPASDNWISTTVSGAPSSRFHHTAVWSGSEMIVWGGNTGAPTSDGGRYDPAGDRWTPTLLAGVPSGRYAHTAVWTGSEMIVWGGWDGLTLAFSDGGRYNPAANSWSTVSAVNAPTARAEHTAVWTGSQMIVWGGHAASVQTDFNTGGSYNPASDTWAATAVNGNTPIGRYEHSAIWTGSEMIVWGGFRYTGFSPPNPPTECRNDGSRYDPVANSWTLLPVPVGGLAARAQHTAIWTGGDMIIWGGSDSTSGTFFNDGSRFRPADASWTRISTTNAPTARAAHTAVWTGSQMVVWGGDAISVQFKDGGLYNPSGDVWSPVTTTGAPAARDAHTALWTGSQMLVWAGHQSAPSQDLNDGGLYDPVRNAWQALSTLNQPLPRDAHTAIWTGSTMLVWGGKTAVGSLFADTYAYTPPQTLFLYTQQ